MKTEKFVVGFMETNCYLLVQESTKECLIVDPGVQSDKLLDHIKKEQYHPVAILLTHGHFDHIGGVDYFRKEFEIPVYACEKEQSVLEDSLRNVSAYYGGSSCVVKNVHYLKDKETIELAGIKIEVITTPGHTCGGCCYYLPEEHVLFSGDTLFCQSIGRSDFPTGNEAQLVASVRDRLFVLPDDTAVYPGHMEETSIGFEKENNPFIR